MVPEVFLSNTLLLVMKKVFPDMQLFPICLTPVKFLPVKCSLVLNQVQNVSQDQATHFTGMGLLGRESSLGSPDL